VSRRFAIYIGLTGVAALAAIVWPGIVLIGLFLGIIPGIVLWIAPSLFVYSLLWWSARAILLKIPTMARIARVGMFRLVVPAVSAAIVATAAVLVPYLINTRAEDAAQSLQAGDREPDKPIALPPVVALVIDGNYNRSKRTPFCETLCLRLLFNSAVARVIAVDPAHRNATSAFWIERRETCPEHANLSFRIRWMTDFPLARGDTPEDRVRTRIAGGECLLEGDGRADEAAMTISYRTVQKGISIFERPWALQPGRPSVNRLEISDASGATIYRRTEVTIVALTVPLQIATAAGLFTTVTYAGWARSDRTLGAIGPQSRDVLPRMLGDAVRKPEFISPQNPSP
jgi:hypothetical protein